MCSFLFFAEAIYSAFRPSYERNSPNKNKNRNYLINMRYTSFFSRVVLEIQQKRRRFLFLFADCSWIWVQYNDNFLKDLEIVRLIRDFICVLSFFSLVCMCYCYAPLTNTAREKNLKNSHDLPERRRMLILFFEYIRSRFFNIFSPLSSSFFHLFLRVALLWVLNSHTLLKWIQKNTVFHGKLPTNCNNFIMRLWK